MNTKPWELAVDAALRTRSLFAPSTLEPTWPIDRRHLEALEVEWPATYVWAPAERWMQTIVSGLKAVVRFSRRPIEQPFKGIALFRLLLTGQSHYIGIDYADHPHIDEQCLKRVALYFKMQYAEDGYRWDSVLPGGFVPGSRELYGVLPAVRKMRDAGRFAYDVYGRFGMSRGTEIRAAALALLGSQQRFRYEGSPRIVRYGRYLREITRARVCLDLPGNGPLCFRLVDYLGVGACVVAVRPASRLHVDLVDGVDIAFVHRDLRDLVDTCARYVEDARAQQRLSAAGRTFFDKFLHRDQLVGYYLAKCLERLL